MLSFTGACHQPHQREVLKVLRKHKLFLKAEKCEFEVLETEYLGVIMSEGGIHMNPIKVKGITEWPMLTKKKELQSFLGFTNFCCHFIKNYSKIVKPMTQLMGNEPWKWGAKQQEAFEQLEKQLAEDVVLAVPTGKGKFCVEADSSEGAISAILSQELDGKWKPVSFLSKVLSIMECNYKIYNKELLAIMLALDKWRHYLMGTFQDFEIWTDHQNLQYFQKLQKLNWWQACWVTELAKYHFTLHHKASTANKKADLLSQQADHEQGKDNNDQVVVLKPEHFQAIIMPTIDKTHDHIKQATHDIWLWDPNVVGSVNHDQAMELKGGLVWYNNRIYVPRNHALQGEVITQSHNYIMAGHPGVKKTKELILWEYWWPKMKKDVEAYICICKTCQWIKSSTQAKAAPLHLNIIPSWPWTHILVDMITGLPESNCYDAIIMIIDWFSKEIITIVCSTELLSEEWAKILCDKVYAKQEMPQVVISDRGTQFISRFMKDLYNLLQIKSNASTAFHLQTNGQTECINQEIEKYLQIFVNHLQTDWANWLPLAAFAHNNCMHSSTGKSPFEVNYGFNPDIVPDVKSQAPFQTPALTTFVSKMQEIHAKAKWSLEKATD